MGTARSVRRERHDRGPARAGRSADPARRPVARSLRRRRGLARAQPLVHADPVHAARAPPARDAADAGTRVAQNVAGAPGSAPGEVDAGGLGAITAQLARAAEVLQSLRGDSATVVRLWQSFVQNPNPGWPAPQARPGAATSVLCAERLRLRSDGNVNAMLADGGMRLCVMVGTNRAIEVSGEAVPFVQRILAERE